MQTIVHFIPGDNTYIVSKYFNKFWIIYRRLKFSNYKYLNYV